MRIALSPRSLILSRLGVTITIYFYPGAAYQALLPSSYPQLTDNSSISNDRASLDKDIRARILLHENAKRGENLN